MWGLGLYLGKNPYSKETREGRWPRVGPNCLPADVLWKSSLTGHGSRKYPAVKRICNRCSPSPPTNILTFKKMMEKLVLFFFLWHWNSILESILGSKAIAALFAPYFASLLSLVLATLNPSALLPVHHLSQDLWFADDMYTFLSWWLLRQFTNLRQLQEGRVCWWKGGLQWKTVMPP